LRSADGYKCDFASADSFPDVARTPEATGSEYYGEHRGEGRLVKRDLAGGHSLHALWKHVDTNDRMTEMGEANACGQSDVSGSYHCDPH